RLLAAPPRLGRYPGELNHLIYEPLGVGVVIAPWNFPLAIPLGMSLAAIAAGNAVVLKPAETASGVAAAAVRLCHAAGLSPGLLNYLPGYGEEVGAYLVSHPQVRFVAFTGSREVGLQILRQAHDTSLAQDGVRRVVCEMGGKNAIVVDSDADLDVAVRSVVESAFGYQGQKCSACSRAVVLSDCYERFVERLIGATASLRFGPPEDPSNTVGPLIDQDALKRVREYLELGRQEARLLYCREPEQPAGFYPPIAIFGEVEPHHRLAREEIFGPVLALQRARDFGEALRLAQTPGYALTGGVISRSPSHLEQARREFRVGNLYLNRGITGALVGRQPFGGLGFSGIGNKAGGPNYLLQFTEERVISENTVRRGFAPPP
ncbi:MAG: aldehyde dehydrogenase family protein, partial [Armatimonadetes bacterium]|nr:aldehyde dehydrogenase family protein [Armatimonadota bacterium]